MWPGPGAWMSHADDVDVGHAGLARRGLVQLVANALAEPQLEQAGRGDRFGVHVQLLELVVEEHRSEGRSA
jgi:hypothetical protein